MNSTEVLHMSSTRVLHTNSTEVVHTNSGRATVHVSPVLHAVA